MKTLAIITACFLVLAYSSGYSQEEEAGERVAGSIGVTIEWTVIDKTFYLEVKNGGTGVFVLDEIFVEGFNVILVGLNSDFKQIHKTELSVLIDRGGITVTKIAPGNFHRTAYRIEHYLKTLPEDVMYMKLKWTHNGIGTKLPKTGLSTSIYELRKDPNNQFKGIDAWGEVKNDLRCRLITEQLPPDRNLLYYPANPFDNLVLEIENTGKKTQTLPALIPGATPFPVIELSILEAPQVKSPSKSGDPRDGSIALKPGEIVKWRLSGAYLIAYGTHQKETGWVRFKPTRRIYHLSIKVKLLEMDWIDSNTIAFDLAE